jgi:hypothetical protein
MLADDHRIVAEGLAPLEEMTQPLEERSGD